MLKMNLQFFAIEGDFEYEPSEDGCTITGYIGSGGVITIPDSLDGMDVTEIGEQAFSSKQLTSVTLPKSLTVIHDQAFGGNYIKSIDLPESVYAIGFSAFGMNQLTSVTIPKNTFMIDFNAFQFNNITEVTINSKTVAIADGVFRLNQDNPADITIYGYPDSTAEQYALGHGHTFKYIPITLNYFNRKEWQTIATQKQLQNHIDDPNLHKEIQVGLDDPTGIPTGGIYLKAVPLDDPSGSPGSNTLIAGDMQAGFFGEVPASELMNGEELTTLVGLTEGIPQHTNEPWLKFAYRGKIQFVAKKPFRYGISWDDLNVLGLVYGDETSPLISIGGEKYFVRLLRGALTDPSKYDESDRGAKGSEWNRLMLPITERATTSNWIFPQYVEDNVDIWNHNLGTGAGGMYSDSDLVPRNPEGGDCHTLCQEVRGGNSSYRVRRGGQYVSNSDTGALASMRTSPNHWRPVLELIQ